MKRILLIILILGTAACSHRQMLDDRKLNMLDGSVSEIIPCNGGELIRFDSAGRMIYKATVDANLNPDSMESVYEYGPWHGNRIERIRLKVGNSEMVNRYRHEISCSSRAVTMRPVKIILETAERIYDTGQPTITMHMKYGMLKTVETGSSHTEYYYEKGARLPYRMTVTENDGSVYSVEYEYPEMDSMGNWLTRLSIRNSDRPVIECRMIRYYR